MWDPTRQTVSECLSHKASHVILLKPLAPVTNINDPGSSAFLAIANGLGMLASEALRNVLVMHD
jgi:hypothetical protein